MRYDILTIFPEIFDSYFNTSMIKRGKENKSIKIKIHNIRDFSDDKHKTVDDTPYGGGPGMVMKVKPIYKCLRSIKPARGAAPAGGQGFASGGKTSKTILLSAKGKTWNQQLVKNYSKLNQLIIICGHYEGVDERVKHFIDEEISIGDYVLTGGELPAMVLVDSISRLIPNFLGKSESLEEESHSKKGYLEYPQYTRPEIFKVGKKSFPVPKVLLSGNHAQIERWREQNAKYKRYK